MVALFHIDGSFPVSIDAWKMASTGFAISVAAYLSTFRDPIEGDFLRG
jgi:hypothetical protein